MAHKFEEKHGSHAQADPVLENALKRVAPDNRLPCAVAFALAAETGAAPIEIGKAADLCGIALVKCQLGLYGYKPEKKIVKPASVVAPELEDAIRGNVSGGRIPCAACWEIAKRLGVPKMSVSAACETLSIKIKPCQLGAF